MSVTLEAIVGNTTYNWSDGAPWRFVSATGVGLPPVRNRRSKGYAQVGSTRLGFDISERIIRIALWGTWATKAQGDTYRDQLAQALQPLTDTPIKLRFTREDGSQRQLDCYANGIVDFPMTVRERPLGLAQQVIIELEALNPMPYDPTIQVLTFDTFLPGNFLVPVDVPWGSTIASNISADQPITYAGAWRTAPEIVIVGPISDPVVTNTTTNETLDFTGITIGSADYYTITTGYGNQAVVDSGGTSRIANLTSDSDLATFHLASHPEATNGINSINVSGTATTGESAVTMRWYNRYLSI